MHEHAHERDGYPPADEWLIGAPRNRPDRWAHRRGEPRGLALVWSCYLLGACGITLFGPASSLSFDAMHIRASSRLLIALVLLGVVVVWPLLRLSQTRPRNPTVSALTDLLIVLTPSAAVVGSTTVLTRWPWETCGALLVLLCAWTLLAGGAIALTTRWTSHAARGASMLAVLAIASASLLATLVAAWEVSTSGGALSPETWRTGRLLAPVSAPYALTTHPDASMPLPDTTAWRAVALPLLPAAAFWTLAATLDLTSAAQGRRRPGARHRGYS